MSRRCLYNWLFIGLSILQGKLKNDCDRSGKQLALDADPKQIQQINFAGNLAQEVNEDTTMYFIIEQAKKNVIDFL